MGNKLEKRKKRFTNKGNILDGGSKVISENAKVQNYLVAKLLEYIVVIQDGNVLESNQQKTTYSTTKKITLVSFCM